MAMGIMWSSIFVGKSREQKIAFQYDTGEIVCRIRLVEDLPLDENGEPTTEWVKIVTGRLQGREYAAFDSAMQAFEDVTGAIEVDAFGKPVPQE